MSSLYLIDGSALAYRSHFAFSRNPLTNAQGMHTGAIYGFLTTLFKLMEENEPDLIAVVFDGPEDTFRHELYEPYKATREKMPDELREQIPWIRKIVEALGIVYLVKPGFEADDIMGTLAKEAEEKGIDAFLVTGDKDFMQLLSDRVKMLTPKKAGVLDTIDASGPMKKWGVPVKNVVDMLGLMGDSSDNVPGVPGVGEKTAQKLIQEFGSIESIYDNLDQVRPPKLQEKLKSNEDQARLCKKLVTIDTRVALSKSVDELTADQPDVSQLADFYAELNFTAFLSKIQTTRSSSSSQEEADDPKDSATNYRLVDTETSLIKLAKELKHASVFAFDTETSSLRPMEAKLVGMSFSTKPNAAHYVPFNHDLSEEVIWTHLKNILEDDHLPKGGQNIKYDAHVLKNHGIDVKGITFDTLIEAYLLEPNQHRYNLDLLAQLYLDEEKTPTEALIGKGKTQISMFDVDLKEIKNYACEDADVSLRLHKKLLPMLEAEDLAPVYQELEIPLLSVLFAMERTGISVSAKALDILSKEFSQELKNLEKDVFDIAGREFNLQSPKQLGEVLFGELKIQDALGIKRVKTTKTGYATDQETLEKYAEHPIIEKILKVRSLSKLLSTYIQALPKLIDAQSGRIHTSFNQAVAATGRLSSSEPNLQNIPIRNESGRRIRKAFVPGHEGWELFSADYSQVELRLLAHLSGDEVFIDAFKKNQDIHARTASEIFEVPLDKVDRDLRGRAKAINFGIIYGMGPQRLARETKIDLKEAKAFIEAYFERYPKIKAYFDDVLTFAKKHEYIETLLGRRRPVPEINSSNPRLSSNAERIAMNTPIQGSAADLIKKAMISIHYALEQKELQSKLLLQVHDELVFEVPKNEKDLLAELVKNHMESAMDLTVPLICETGFGLNWDEAH